MNIYNLLLFMKLNHWITQRFAIFLFLILLCSVFYFDSLNLIPIVVFFLSFHFFTGLCTLIDDYIHDDYLYLYAVTFIKIFNIFLLKSIMIVFI